MVVNLLLCTFIVVDITSRPGRHWLGLTTVAVLFGALACRYWADGVRKLEISDEGLVMKPWLRRPLGIAWSAVSSVKMGYEVLSFSSGTRFPSAVVNDSVGKAIAIPGTCADSAEMIGILRQRLPSGLFEER